jgi:uncharacterized protein YecE (DUF72 family)
MAAGEIYIGTSGWHYAHWSGPFYPESMKADAYLSFYASKFRSVEINNTFYHLPEPKTLAQWRDITPPGFLFACKASRYITHMKKLKDPGQTVCRFFDVIATLGPKLGPILFQLPPHWHLDSERLRLFLAALPGGLRFAFEFRDESWFAPQVFELLEQRGAAFCAYDFNGRQSPVRVTASFVYVRLHGPDGPYRGQYSGRTLAGWAKRFLAWQKSGLDIYCYFDNDEAAYAAQDAMRLAGMVAGRSAAARTGCC